MKTQIAILAVALALTGCKSKTLTTQQTQTANAQASKVESEQNKVAYGLLEGQWTIMDINGEQVNTTDDADKPYVRFEKNQENPNYMDLMAYTGCNFLNGTISLDGNKIVKQGEMLKTLKACADAKYETPLVNALNKMQTLKIEKLNNESFLYLKTNSGNPLVTLRRHNINFLEGAWQVAKVMDKNTSKKNMKMVIDLENNTLHGSAGCNVMNGKVNVNMSLENGIRFSDVITTRMTCPDLEDEYLLLNTLKEVVSVQPGITSNNEVQNVSLLNAKGETVIQLKRISRDKLNSDRD